MRGEGSIEVGVWSKTPQPPYQEDIVCLCVLFFVGSVKEISKTNRGENQIM